MSKARYRYRIERESNGHWRPILAGAEAQKSWCFGYLAAAETMAIAKYRVVQIHGDDEHKVIAETQRR